MNHQLIAAAHRFIDRHLEFHQDNDKHGADEDCQAVNIWLKIFCED